MSISTDLWIRPCLAFQNIDDNRALKKAMVALYKLYNSVSSGDLN